MKLKPRKLILVLTDEQLARKRKRCVECGRSKPYTEYHKFNGGSARSADGFRTACKACRRIKEAERQRNRRKEQ